MSGKNYKPVFHQEFFDDMDDMGLSQEEQQKVVDEIKRLVESGELVDQMIPVNDLTDEELNELRLDPEQDNFGFDVDELRRRRLH